MHKVLRLCLLLLLLAALPVTVFAQEFDPHQRGTISLSMVSPGEEIPLEGAQLALYYVASVKAGDDGQLLYSYTEEFADCGISLGDSRLVEKLDAFISQNDLSAKTVFTDGQGNARWDNLVLGLYLVKQIGQVEGFATCASFLVTVPMTGENEFLYAVDASPKMEVSRLVTVTVQKVWNTDNTAQIPDNVVVQLVRGETVLSTDVLNAENNWQVIYPDMPESDAYRIEELDVAKGFTATYGRKGYVFTVTNTSSLVQTGQLIWPIPVLAVAGLFLLAVGYGILRKQGKQNG